MPPQFDYAKKRKLKREADHGVSGETHHDGKFAHKHVHYPGNTLPGAILTSIMGHLFASEQS